MILSGTLTVILNGVLSELAGFLPENVPEGVSYRTEDEQRPAESGQVPSYHRGTDQQLCKGKRPYACPE